MSAETRSAKTLIIAEAGVNHNGDPALAAQLVDAAAEAGADMVKFQAFRATDLVAADAPKAAYQKETTNADESQQAMLRKLELPEAVFHDLRKRCLERGIGFLVTPFDLPSLEMLTRMQITALKIPSGEITNLPYLRAIGRLALTTFLSTGMSTLDEVAAAVTALETAGLPREKLWIMHCTTEYPAPFDEVNLRAMHALATAFPGARIGYSDHTQGITVPVAAAALGAAVVEKHFTLSRAMEGPDHKASLEPRELEHMIRAIREAEAALGDGVKQPTPSELPNRAVVRKSIVAARPIAAGEVFSEANLAVKRPGVGISPMKWDCLIGRAAGRAYERDACIHSAELPVKGNS